MTKDEKIHELRLALFRISDRALSGSWSAETVDDKDQFAGIETLAEEALGKTNN